MSVVGGIIMWMTLILLIGGYFVAKRYGDKHKAQFGEHPEDFQKEEQDYDN
jgi:hypothetical protein